MFCDTFIGLLKIMLGKKNLKCKNICVNTLKQILIILLISHSSVNLLKNKN